VRLHAAFGMGRAALALVRDYPLAWVGVVGWFAILTAMALSGSAVVLGARTSLGNLEESFGIHVLVAPDAAGLAALNHAISGLPGVRDAKFVVQPRPLRQFPDTIQARNSPASLYVRTRLVKPESLQEVAAAIRSFPKVETVVYSPELAQRVYDARTAVVHLTRAAWSAAVVIVMIALSLPGTGLVRSHRRQALVAYALGASRLQSAAPASIAGAVGGALGGLLAWLAINVAGGAGSTAMHQALRGVSAHGGLALLGALFLGTLGPLIAIIGVLWGRRPSHLDPGAP